MVPIVGRINNTVIGDIIILVYRLDYSPHSYKSVFLTCPNDSNEQWDLLASTWVCLTRSNRPACLSCFRILEVSACLGGSPLDTAEKRH